MHPHARLVAMLSCLALAGCSVFFDPDDHLAGSDTDGGGLDGGGVDGGDVDSGLDAGPRVDAVVMEDAGREERCPAVAEPSTFCADTVDVGTGGIDLGTLVPEAHLSLAIVEHGDELAVVSGLLESGTPHLLYNPLRSHTVVASPTDSLNVADAAEGVVGVRPTGVRSLGMRRVESRTVGLTFLGADTGADSSDVWLAGAIDGALDSIDNLSGTTPVFGHAALTGPEGGATARHFWRDLPAGGGMVIASLPHEDWSARHWRATQAGVDDTESSVAMRGSDGAFVATLGETAGTIQLWSGLGADEDNPTAIDAAAPAIEYAYGGPGIMLQFDFAWVGGDRYALAFVSRDGGNYAIGLVRAACSVSCTADDPEVCTNECAFGPYEVVNPVGGVDDARVAITGAGPNAVAVAAASAIDTDHWTITLSVLDSYNFAQISSPEGVPWLEVVDEFSGGLYGLEAASRTAGATVDVVVARLDSNQFYDVALFQPCLCP